MTKPMRHGKGCGKMDDLVKRLREPRDLFASRTIKKWTEERKEAADYIEALERQVKAADALAEALTTYNRGGAGPLTGWLNVEQALAAYRAATEGGE